MVQCGNLLGDQKLLHAEECVSGCIVMLQNPGFACPQSPSLLTNIIHKTSRDFLLKVLISCLSLRYPLIMHQVSVVEEKRPA